LTRVVARAGLGGGSLQGSGIPGDLGKIPGGLYKLPTWAH
jgi:hypothetical protein